MAKPKKAKAPAKKVVKKDVLPKASIKKKPQSALTDKKPVFVSLLEIKAVLPTRQYENIQPLIQMKDVDLKKGTELAMKHINEIAEKYGEKGKLNVNDVVEIKGTPVGSKDPIRTRPLIEMKSFNEEGVVVMFDRDNHEYYYEGKQLTSATTLLKKFYKEFNAEQIAPNCEKAWGVPKEEILSMWSMSGEVASMFGTAIHNALEYSEKYRANGANIAKVKKDKVNPAILKHPIIQDIVYKFYAMYSKLAFGSVVHTEVLVTDVKAGYCGQIDRLVCREGESKNVRVQDYKVNIEAEKKESKMKIIIKGFEKLPQNKISKYQIQMSIYGNMLTKSGFKVEGLDAFVLDEEWKHYPLEMLKIIK